MGVIILTDSTCDLSEELVKRYSIAVAPLTVHFKEKQYKDTIDISSKQFFDMLVTCDEIPKTSQVNPLEFQDIFKELIDKGNEVVGIFLSSDLSGTYNSAKLGRDMLEEGADRIHIIDSRTVSVGLGALAVKSAQLVEQGKTAEEIVNEIEKIKNNVIAIAVPETLEYLQKGGRLSSAKAMIANVLNIKPVLTIKDGVIEPIDKVRGFQKGISYFLEYIKEHIASDTEVFVLNADNTEMTGALVEKLKQQYQIQNVYVCDLGPAIGVHLGKGAIGLAFVKRSDLN